MGFIYFNLIVAVLAYVLMTLTEVDYAHKFKARYPDLKVPESSIAGKMASIIKSVVGSLIPIVNLAILWVLIFHSSDLEDKVMKRMCDTCAKNKEDKSCN